MTQIVLGMTCLAALFAFALARGEEPAALDSPLPQPLDPAFAGSLLKNSPFTRPINPADSMQLTGVAYIDGKAAVTVKDTTTKKSHVISDKPNAQGWRLVQARPKTQSANGEAQIEIGGETVTVHYRAEQTAPRKKSGYMPSRVPTPEEFTGRDEKGAYVRGMPYLSDEDRARMYNVPREVRDRFLKVVHDHRDMLFKASHEERASFVKKVYDSVMQR